MKRRFSALPLALALSFSVALSGCATVGGRSAAADPVKQAVGLIKREQAGDARFMNVRGREFLVFDADLRSRLDAYPADAPIEQKRELLLELLSDAKGLGDRAMELQLKRVAPDRITESRPDLPEAYRVAAASAFDKETVRVMAIGGADELDRYARALRSDIEASIKTKGRTLRQVLLLPFAPFAHAWIGHHTATEVREKGGVEYAEIELYEPPAPPPGDVLSMDDAALLAYFAPAIAIEKKAEVKYDRDSDRFGTVRMEGKTSAEAQPAIDTRSPALYGYAETKTVQGTPVKMLVYTLWFPERPNIDGGFDPEVGSTQGAIIRVSLGTSREPLVYENVSSCGCYFKVFPTEALEARARQKYGAPLEKKSFVLENDVPGKIDANVPTLVGPGERVIAFFSAGKHEATDIRPRMPDATRTASRTEYRLLPYEELESLPFNGGTISMFGADGLVRSADRLESTLLAASGMYHPGTPRQRGTLMIYFDQADFDDPLLLERYLRLPDHAFRSAD